MTTTPDDTTGPTTLATLSNGVRMVAIRLPHLDSASASVFVCTGSLHETARSSGISHVVEHMAFKGTHERDCRRINLDAELLGAEVNAHTDKDHTAYHMRGLAEHAGQFVTMLGDIVRHSTFPEVEFERERQVILQEVLEDDDDPVSTAFKLVDQASWGHHAMARPVIGSRRNIERFTRAELLDYVARQYSASNVIVGVAGNIDPQVMARQVEAAFGDMPAGSANHVEPPVFVGGIRTRRQAGSSQSHVVMGYPLPPLTAEDATGVLAAALFGEGMSSPLLHEIREQRGLVYYAACSADVGPLAGQFIIEASTTPEHLDELFGELVRLLAQQAETIDPLDLQRARNQIAVRRMRTRERPYRRLEEAAQDLYTLGRLRSQAELDAQFAAVDAEALRRQFARMLGQTSSVAVAGKLSQGLRERIHAAISSVTPATPG